MSEQKNQINKINPHTTGSHSWHSDVRIKFIGLVSGFIILFAITLGAVYFWQKILPQSQKQAIKQSVDSLRNDVFELKPDFGDSTDEIILPPKTKFLYKKGYDIYLYDTATSTPKHILSSDILKDFTLSPDGKFLAYTIKESGFFSDNSDAYLVDLEKNKVKRLDPKNNIATFNPKIFPDNSQVAFVRREYSTSTKSVSGGEIWIVDADANASSSKKLFEAKKIEGLKDAEFCVTEAEKKSVKIGINNISPDGKIVTYWNKDWAPECSGLWQKPYFSNIDGSNFLTDKFLSQNTFTTINHNEKNNWDVSQIFWSADKSFVVYNTAPAPFGGWSIYNYDKNQNKKWQIYDSMRLEMGSQIGFGLKDIFKKTNNNLLIIYEIYESPSSLKYFIEEIKDNSEINLDGLNFKQPFASEAVGENTILQIKILNEEKIIYSKKISDKTFGLFLYNIKDKTEQKIDEAKSPIIFDF